MAHWHPMVRRLTKTRGNCWQQIKSLINMTTGVIYARVSSIGDRQNTERQVKDLSEYAKYKGF